MPNKKRVFIIHGWDGYPEEGIFPWLKQELQVKGFDVFVPAMPEPSRPEIRAWVEFLSDQVGDVDDKTYFIGHSIGAQAILRYLEALPDGAKAGGAVFLAGWVNLTEDANETEDDWKIADPWLKTPLDWGKIKSHTDRFTAIFSDDDPLVPLSDAQIFERQLGAKIIIETAKDHFSGSTGIKQLPSILESVLEISDGNNGRIL